MSVFTNLLNGTQDPEVQSHVYRGNLVITTLRNIDVNSVEGRFVHINPQNYNEESVKETGTYRLGQQLIISGPTTDSRRVKIAYWNRQKVSMYYMKWIFGGMGGYFTMIGTYLLPTGSKKSGLFVTLLGLLAFITASMAMNREAFAENQAAEWDIPTEVRGEKIRSDAILRNLITPYLSISDNHDEVIDRLETNPSVRFEALGQSWLTALKSTSVFKLFFGDDRYYQSFGSGDA